MSFGFCEKHGWMGGEQVSKLLYEKYRNGQDISESVRDFSFVIDDLDWPFYGLLEEIGQMTEACVGGDFTIESDERLSEVLGRITIICVSCLKEAMHGAPLPVKEGGQ